MFKMLHYPIDFQILRYGKKLNVFETFRITKKSGCPKNKKSIAQKNKKIDCPKKIKNRLPK